MPHGASRAGQGHARQGAQHGAAAEVPRHPALRPGASGRRWKRQKELQNPTELQFLGPTPENSVAGQIEIVTNATTQGVNAIMISNNSGDQIVPAAKAAQDKGIKVVTWDSPIPSAEGEDVFVAQVDFTETGKVMADMALDDPRRRRRQVRHPLGLARRRQPERLDRRHARRR